MNFPEWWLQYNDQNRPVKEVHNFVVGGKEWMAAFAAWQYSEILTKQKAEAKNPEFAFLKFYHEKISACLVAIDGTILEIVKQQYMKETGKPVPEGY